MINVFIDRNGSLVFHMQVSSAEELESLAEMAWEEGYLVSSDYWPEYA